MSKFTADTMKKAWAIRRAAAVKFGCRVSEVSWKECLKMAAQNDDSEKKAFIAQYIANVRAKKPLGSRARATFVPPSDEELTVKATAAWELKVKDDAFKKPLRDVGIELNLWINPSNATDVRYYVSNLDAFVEIHDCEAVTAWFDTSRMLHLKHDLRSVNIELAATIRTLFSTIPTI